MLLVYGAYGYTGELIVRHALERGIRPVVAGRDPSKLEPLAKELGLDARVFGLRDPVEVKRGLAGARVVLHCAGPFFATFDAMARACIATGAHYLDITGEGPVFRAAQALSGEAGRAGVMLLPGAGFDVVPTDAMAAHLVRRMPDATTIVLAFKTTGGVSRGTAKTAMALSDSAPADPRRHPASRTFDFGRGPAPCLSIAWGDLVTAPHSTGVKDVATYMAAPRQQRLAMRLMPHLAPALRLPFVGPAAVALLTRGKAGPDAAARERGRSIVVGEASGPDGRRIVSRSQHVEAYRFTALAAVELARRALAGDAKRGWQTPSSAYGADVAQSIPGSSREDLA
ncbi:MAG: saccharopine dehydrogenase NADP-binding domain-containing protein [Anaeromyxobacteraceae bacterium]